MIFDERLSPGRSPFERLLEQIEDRSPPSEQIAPPVGDERIWSGFTQAPPMKLHYASPEAYDQDEISVPMLSPAPRPDPYKLAADFDHIRGELHAARRVEDLKLLRRRCALVAHPDRIPATNRAMAEQFMAEINAAIDRAIKDRSPPRPRR